MKMFAKNYLVQIQEYINENSLKTTSKKKLMLTIQYYNY